MMYYPTQYTVWDLETSGLDPVNDRILEIGAVRVNSDGTKEEMSWLLKYPGFQVSETTVNLTGITQEEIEEHGEDPNKALQEFLVFIEGRQGGDVFPNVTHNGYRFDIPFLESFVLRSIPEKYRGNYISGIRRGMLDTAVLYKAQKLGDPRRWYESFDDYAQRIMAIRAYGVKYNIPLCCEELGIDTSNAVFHRALGDATLTNEIYKKLCL